MINFTNSKAFVATALAATAFGLAPAAYAGNSHYNNCKSSSDDQIIAGIIGAVAGGVLGSQVSGNGARTEGSVIGAAVGAAAGASLAGGNDCNRSRPRQVSANHYTNASHSTQVYSGHSNRHYNNGRYKTSKARKNRSSSYGHSHNYGSSYNQNYNYNQSYGSGYNNGHSRQQQLRQIDRQIDELRDRRKRLEARAHYHPSHKLDRKLHKVGNQLRDLKDQRRRLKKNKKSHNSGHYHNGNVCYAHH